MIGRICQTNKVFNKIYCLETVRLRNSQNMKLLSIENAILVLVMLPSPPPLTTVSPHVYTRLLRSSRVVTMVFPL